MSAKSDIPKGLQRRFALIAGLLLIALSLVFLVIVTSLYRGRILEAHERASLSVNHLLQAALENAMVKRDLDGLQDIVTRLGAQAGIEGVRILHPSGEIRFSSYPDQLYTPFKDPSLEAALTSKAAQAGFRTLAGGREVLRSINPVQNKEICTQCHGAIGDNPINGLLVVDYISTDVRKAARDGAILLGLLGVGVLIAIEAGLWFALRRFVLDRLDHLRQATRALADGDFSAIAQDGGQDEIDALARDFNSMAGQLNRSVENLRASRGFLQSLIDAIPDGVRVIDGQFNTLMVNNAYCRQIGSARDQMVGQPCYASSHHRADPCVPTLVRCPVVEIIHGDGDRLKCSHRFKSHDGHDLPVEIFAAPVMLQIDGRDVPCIVESVRDLQAQLSISQEQRLAEMGMLAAGVAHEVNNPLTSVGLALRAIGREPGQSEKVQKYLKIAETEVENCRRFSESLLRLAASPQQVAELVDMGRVVTDTVALLGFQAEQNCVKLQVDAQKGAVLRATDSDMRTLVFNLLLNAIHAMPQGGSATVSVAVVETGVQLIVADTGIGIAREDHNKVLLPFWTKRADGTRGRGLGLSICSGIVERLGGQIRFDSEPGAGTRFQVTLPLAERAKT